MSELFGPAAARLGGHAATLLGWRPADFWNSTPAELAMVLEPGPDGAPPDPDTLAELRRRFPDNEG